MTYIDGRVDPEGGVKENVVKEVLEKGAPDGKVHQVLGELQETVKDVLGHVLP